MEGGERKTAAKERARILHLPPSEIAIFEKRFCKKSTFSFAVFCRLPLHRV